MVTRLLLLWFLAGCGAPPLASSASSPSPPAPRASPTSGVARASRPIAPALQAQSLEGKTVTLADFRGQVVVLDVMASWCTTCVETLPRWHALAERLRQHPARILLVSQDEELDDLRALVQRASIRETVLIDAGEVWWNAFSLRFLPTAIVIGADGRVAGQVRNLADGGFEQLEALIDAELARVPTSAVGCAPRLRRHRPGDPRGS